MQLCKRALSLAMGGVLSLSVTQAGADSLLVPWVVIDEDAGIQTFLQFKVEGTGEENCRCRNTLIRC